MPVSATKRRNNDNYNAKCDAITIRPLKATGTAIRAAAAAAGQSLQGYILQAVRARMEQEGQPLEIEQTPAESGKVENLTPPANGKNAPDGAPPAPAVTLERRQRERCQR